MLVFAHLCLCFGLIWCAGEIFLMTMFLCLFAGQAVQEFLGCSPQEAGKIVILFFSSGHHGEKC
jgi:hypothetical protein